MDATCGWTVASGRTQYIHHSWNIDTKYSYVELPLCHPRKNKRHFQISYVWYLYILCVLLRILSICEGKDCKAAVSQYLIGSRSYPTTKFCLLLYPTALPMLYLVNNKVLVAVNNIKSLNIDVNQQWITKKKNAVSTVSDVRTFFSGRRNKWRTEDKMYKCLVKHPRQWLWGGCGKWGAWPLGRVISHISRFPSIVRRFYQDQYKWANLSTTYAELRASCEETQSLRTRFHLMTWNYNLHWYKCSNETNCLI